LPSDLQMQNNQKKRLKLLAKVLLSIAYVTVGAEFFLRVLAPVPMLPRYICAAEYGIRANEGNRAYWHRTPEYKVHIRTNSKGIRADKEISYDKPEDIKRVVVLGDSFGMGYGVNLEDTFTSQMEQNLLSAGITCEVINLSSSGHGNAEELIVLRNEGLKYDPDLVLLAWHSTDRGDNIRSNLFTLEQDKIIRKAEIYLPAVKVREFLFSFAVYRWLAGNCHLYNFVRDRTASIIKLKLFPAIRSLSNRDITKPGIVNDIGAIPYSDRLAFALLKEIQRESLENGARLLILSIPYRLSRNEFVSTFPAYEESKQFIVFDPIDLFKQQDGKMLYWERSHGHFTPLGCRIVGEGLAKKIIELGLI
jgi:hypothetical protein